MFDPFDSSASTGALAGLAIPKGRHVGSSGNPLFRVTFLDPAGKRSVQLVESATKESARAWAQRKCAERAVTVVSVGRWLGGPIPDAYVSNENARNAACDRLVNALHNVTHNTPNTPNATQCTTRTIPNTLIA